MSGVGDLDPKLLLAFCALMDERSVTLAAKRIDLSQQGMSGLLQRMRQIFDDPLFVREARGVSPTPCANEIYPRVKDALASLEMVLDQKDFEPASARNTIRIVASDYSLSVIVSPLFNKFRQLAPEVSLVAVPFDAANIGEQLRNGAADLAMTSLRFAPRNFHTRHLLHDRYVCAVRTGHPLAGCDVDLDAFCSFEHLAVSPRKGALLGLVDVVLTRHNRERKIGVILPSFTVAGNILEHTDLISVLPERLVKTINADLHVFPPPVEIEDFQIITIWPERVNADPLHSWCRQFFHEAVL